MKLISIEPTPSPNSMKLNVDEALPQGFMHTYSSSDTANGACPAYVKKLLAIDGVKSVFRAADFIALERQSKGQWAAILAEARAVLNGNEERTGRSPDPSAGLAGEADGSEAVLDEHFGEAQVLLQMFRQIPLQIRVRTGGQEARSALPERFTQAAFAAQKASPNLIMERKLEELGVRYGDPQEILQQVAQEIDAAYDDERLHALVEAALAASPTHAAAPENAPSAAAPAAGGAGAAGAESSPAEEAALRRTLQSDPDWRKRYAALGRLRPTLADAPLLAAALDDDNASIRRLAVVYLGDLREPEVFSSLYKALKDSSVQVRRTAGDCLSDIGDPDAIMPMTEALRDPSKLVRWRAARYLFEVGDERALPVLREAENDPEFEISMQAKMAIARIEGGEAAEGSVWQQMTRRNEKKE